MRITISPELARKCGSEGAALVMMGIADKVCPKTGEVLKTPRKGKRKQRKTRK